MTIEVIFKDSSAIRQCSVKEFEQLMQMQWSPHLQFTTPKIQAHVQKRCTQALKKEEIDQKQKWLGIYYAKELKSGSSPPLLIAWMNSQIGYGVRANSVLLPGQFIGEYTGAVRKRKKWKDRKNSYCFEYAIGDSWKTPYLIDAQEIGNHTRFINHSTHSNLEPLSVYFEGAMHVILIAKRKILPNEYLTYDYGEEYWKKRKNLIVDSQ